MISALFVEKYGVYFNLPGVDPWDKERDARGYQGPNPIVAHPPCQLWGNLAAVNFARWGGEHNRPGNDDGCFASAKNCVLLYGGVLEHPKNSRAFQAHGIKKPYGIGWNKIGKFEWVCEVWQSEYGHKANKATWLYYVGNNTPNELRWGRKKGTHQIGFQDQRGKDRNKPTLSKKEANATPIEFRDELIKLAANSLIP